VPRPPPVRWSRRRRSRPLPRPLPRRRRPAQSTSRPRRGAVRHPHQQGGGGLDRALPRTVSTMHRRSRTDASRQFYHVRAAAGRALPP